MAQIRRPSVPTLRTLIRWVPRQLTDAVWIRLQHSGHRPLTETPGLDVAFHCAAWLPASWTVLHLGCGAAPHAVFFAQHARYLGVDADPRARVSLPTTTHFQLSPADFLTHHADTCVPAHTLVLCAPDACDAQTLAAYRQRFPLVIEIPSLPIVTPRARRTSKRVSSQATPTPRRRTPRRRTRPASLPPSLPSAPTVPVFSETLQHSLQLTLVKYHASALWDPDPVQAESKLRPIARNFAANRGLNPDDVWTVVLRTLRPLWIQRNRIYSALAVAFVTGKAQRIEDHSFWTTRIRRDGRRAWIERWIRSIAAVAYTVQRATHWKTRALEWGQLTPADAVDAVKSLSQFEREFIRIRLHSTFGFMSPRFGAQRITPTMPLGTVIQRSHHLATTVQAAA